jgi:hypothetical protein
MYAPLQCPTCERGHCSPLALVASWPRHQRNAEKEALVGIIGLLVVIVLIILLLRLL